MNEGCSASRSGSMSIRRGRSVNNLYAVIAGLRGLALQWKLICFISSVDVRPFLDEKLSYVGIAFTVVEKSEYGWASYKLP